MNFFSIGLLLCFILCILAAVAEGLPYDELNTVGHAVGSHDTEAGCRGRGSGRRGRGRGGRNGGNDNGGSDNGGGGNGGGGNGGGDTGGEDYGGGEAGEI